MDLILIERINSIIAWLSVVLMLLLSLPAFTRYIVRKLKLSKTHRLSRINKKLHKFHVQLSVLCSVCIVIHIILSYILLKHFPLLGYIIFLLFVLLVLSGYLKKRMSAKWFTIHKKATLLILIIVLLHIVYELP